MPWRSGACATLVAFTGRAAVAQPAVFKEPATAAAAVAQGRFFGASIWLAASEMATPAGCFSRRSTEIAK